MSGNPDASGGASPPGQQAKPVDLWRPVPPLPEPEPIVPRATPPLIVRSLGDPPLQGQGAAAEHEIARVLVRASMLASALADVAGLLDRPDPA